MRVESGKWRVDSKTEEGLSSLLLFSTHYPLPTIHLVHHHMSNLNSPAARLPAKLHRRVCIVLTEDAVLAEEILARKKLAGEIVGRLSDRALLIRPGRFDAVLDELRKMGQTPQVVGKP